MARKRHPDKDVEIAIRFAEKRGWRYQPTGNSAHAWGRLLCPLRMYIGCALSIWSTPRNAKAHARQTCKVVKNCKHAVQEIQLC